MRTAKPKTSVRAGRRGTLVILLAAAVALAWLTEYTVHRVLWRDFRARMEEGASRARNLGDLVDATYETVMQIRRDHPVWTFAEDKHVLYVLFPVGALAFWVRGRRRRSRLARSEPAGA